MNDDEPIKYRKDFIKIMFWLEDDLPLSQTFNFLEIITVVACGLEKNGKCYPHIFFTWMHVQVMRILQYKKN